jgi:hypothetical protein
MASVVSHDYWSRLTPRRSAAIRRPRCEIAAFWRFNDDDSVESNHPLSEDVSPPVFAMVALIIVAISLAVFALLGIFP